MRSSEDVRRALLEREELALLDVRSEAVFAQAHPLFAASLPRGRLDLEVRDRLPRLDAPIVVYDNGEGLAGVGARRLVDLGYSQVAVLDGGLSGWIEAGYELFRDVNTPSKAFGELVAERCATPLVSAKDLAEWLGRGDDVVVADVRRFDEYTTMSIPTASSVPGGELVLRSGMLAPSPKTRIAVNCAGRTRSIIGAQSLINAGVDNSVVALENGTIGWALAGFTLDSAADASVPLPEVPDARLRDSVRALADRAGVRYVDPEELDAAIGGVPVRTVYRFDVRSAGEYESGHPRGFRWAPGGQLVQETDVFAPVRGALIVLADDDGVRASMTGSWLAQMGWDVVVVDILAGFPIETGRWQPTVVTGGTATDLDDQAQDGEARDDGAYVRPYVGTDIDPAVMQAYIDWELGLVEQLDRDGTHGFRVLEP